MTLGFQSFGLTEDLLILDLLQQSRCLSLGQTSSPDYSIGIVTLVTLLLGQTTDIYTNWDRDRLRHITD